MYKPSDFHTTHIRLAGQPSCAGSLRWRLMLRASALKFGRVSGFALLATACIGWGLYAAFDALRPPVSMQVRLGAGSTVARRFRFAETFAAEARKQDLYAEVVATEGFEDSIRQVANGQLDLAMVSSGLDAPECDEVRVLAGLDLAPLHILVRRELAERELSLSQIIKGRRINLGQPGTNDYILANEIVRFLRLSPKDEAGKGDYVQSSLDKEELNQLALNAQSENEAERQASLSKLPEVIMTVASLPGIMVQNLLDTGEYRLAPFSNVEPFLISEMHHVGGPEGSVDRILVEPATINAGMYLGDSLAHNSDLPTVGLRTLLVARADLPPATIQRIMTIVFETNFSRRVKPKSTRELATAYQIHPEAEAYLNRNEPLLTGSSFDMLSKSLSIFGAFSAGALSIYGYLRRRRIRRPGEYLEEIRQIDAIASGVQPSPDEVLSPD